jgi:thiamine biosynthesis lipoprotein ApbE
VNGYETDLLSATIVGDTSSVADGLATAVCVLGSTGGRDILERSGFEAILVARGKSLFVTPGLAGSVRPLSSDIRVRALAAL